MKPLLDRALPAAGLLVVRVARLRKRFAGCASICISNPLDVRDRWEGVLPVGAHCHLAVVSGDRLER